MPYFLAAVSCYIATKKVPEFQFLHILTHIQSLLLKNEILPYVTKWMNLEDNMQSPSQRTDIAWLCLHEATEIDSETETSMVAAIGWWKEEMGSYSSISIKFNSTRWVKYRYLVYSIVSITTVLHN